MTRQYCSALILTVVSVILFSSCAKEQNPDERLVRVLTPLRDQYASDRRVAVFSVTPEWQNGVLVAKGEVDNPQAKADALAALKSAANVDPVDSIIVLPDPRLGDSTFAIVTVSVGNVKSRPGHAEELANQLLMGMVVKVLKERGGWSYIQSNDDYLGWIQSETIFRTNREGADEWIRSPKLIATDYFTIIRSEARSGSLPVSDVVAGALMRQGRTAGSWREVILPDGRRGFVERAKVEDYQKWRSSRKLNAQNVEETAKLFLGVPYLWGGTSPKGFDCSGFTKTIFRLNGVELERDANQQATMGEDVGVGSDFQGLKKGDLIFFGRKATGDRPERIGHVGIYLGKREFIHCPNRVRINSLDPTSPLFDPWWLETFVRARRITSTTQIPEVG